MKDLPAISPAVHRHTNLVGARNQVDIWTRHNYVIVQREPPTRYLDYETVEGLFTAADLKESAYNWSVGAEPIRGTPVYWEVLSQWGEFDKGLEAGVIDWFNTRDFEAITISSIRAQSKPADRRLTYDILRRGCRATLLVLAATQVIYVLTGVLILNPAAGVLLMFVTAGFHRMSTLMEREFDQVVQGPNIGEARWLRRPLHHDE
jgi:hypothetical protein